MIRLVNQIAAEIEVDWKRPSDAALPYLNAMKEIEHLHEKYGEDSAKEIVARFLSVANDWRGDTARRIKKELNNMLDAA